MKGGRGKGEGGRGKGERGRGKGEGEKGEEGRGNGEGEKGEWRLIMLSPTHTSPHPLSTLSPASLSRILLTNFYM